MKNLKIIHIGKALFWLSFALGNLCLLGYFFSEQPFFAIGGLYLLIYGSVVNLIAFFGLLIYGSFHQKQFDECSKSALILLINIPIAILYYFIGVSIL